MADESRLAELEAALKKLTDGSNGAVSAIGAINRAVLETGKGIDATAESFNAIGNSMRLFTDGMGGVLQSTTGLGTSFEKLAEGMGALQGGINALGTAYVNSLRIADEFSAVTRTLNLDNFMLAASFGQTRDVAEKFTETLLSNAETLASAKMGYQNFANEILPLRTALAESRISFEKQEEQIVSTAGSFSLYEMGVLQAQSLGMSLTEYSDKMSSLMIKQGMSAQDAAQTMSIYGDISSETGITVGVIADKLGGLGDSFRKAGLDANFGESFLRGFADALEETGIGIENAAELAQMFGERMANLGTNYSSAFVTAQRGGLDMGSGGALGAGIQMQAKLLDPETDQAEFGREMAGAVRDSLASFTGGDIVTVAEAAESRDPAKEAQYYMQTQLLGSMYGITDATDQARTLELLEQMATAEATGDQEAMAMLGEDIKDTLGIREKTLSEEEKANTQLTAIFAENALHTQLFQQMLSQAAGQIREGPMNEFAGLMDNVEARVDILSESMQNPDDKRSYIEQMRDALRNEGKEMEALRQEPTPTAAQLGGAGSDMLSILKGTLSVQDTELKRSIDALAGVLRDNMKPTPQNVNGGKGGTAGTTSGP